jgi:hypothetical protein
MIGPLATPEMVAKDLAAAEAPAPETRANGPEQPALAGEPEPPIPPCSVERCGAIAARIARRPEDLGAILEAEKLTPETWESTHAERLQEIQAEVGRGKRKLLSAYDAAYVAALEEARGPITPGEYARLVISAERGSSEATLAELGLPEEAMMRIRRVWLERTVKDAKLGAAVRAAMRKAAEE